jgi:hypothetical protein
MLLQSGCLIKINHTPGAKRLLFVALPVRAAHWPGSFRRQQPIPLAW